VNEPSNIILLTLIVQQITSSSVSEEFEFGTSTKLQRYCRALFFGEFQGDSSPASRILEGAEIQRSATSVCAELCRPRATTDLSLVQRVLPHI